MRKLVLALCAATLLTTLPVHAAPHRPHHVAGSRVCWHPWYTGRGHFPRLGAIRRTIECFSARIGYRPRYTSCIAKRESHYYPFAHNGDNLGVFQESAWSMVWAFFKRSHPGKWLRTTHHGVFNGRAQALAEPWWMLHHGTGRWPNTSRMCGG